MRNPFAIPGVVVLLCLSAFAQTNAVPQPAQARKSPLVPYAGNWIGAFEGKPWFILNLNLAGEQFSGSLQHARHIEINDTGDLKSVSEEFGTQTVVDGKLNPDGLLLSLKDPDTQEIDRYMMKLTSDTTAEIRVIGMAMPPGMPKPKPWKLAKASSAPAQKR
jgi:hypothetical protein